MKLLKKMFMFICLCSWSLAGEYLMASVHFIHYTYSVIYYFHSFSLFYSKNIFRYFCGDAAVTFKELMMTFFEITTF